MFALFLCPFAYQVLLQGSWPHGCEASKTFFEWADRLGVFRLNREESVYSPNQNQMNGFSLHVWPVGLSGFDPPKDCTLPRPRAQLGLEDPTLRWVTGDG